MEEDEEETDMMSAALVTRVSSTSFVLRAISYASISFDLDSGWAVHVPFWGKKEDWVQKERRRTEQHEWVRNRREAAVASTSTASIASDSLAKGEHIARLESHRREQNLTEICFTSHHSAEVKLLSQEFEDNGYTYRPVLSCLSWLDGYFGDVDRIPQVPLPPICEATCFSKGSFQGLVWRTLVEAAGPGTTLSYGQLAALCGNPGASRAVGSALRRNPLQLVVPCHRVVRGDGSPGHYSGGSRDRVKHWLLSHEGCPCPVTRH